ncbi:(E3-independent) E2 ubiquitin-conjugating enzyme UBE2O-like [Macrobrachium rosenbergii]|uniref:(E3-independent) E2 ubiquitin-conjugating enzyme UBE2O-like n=1 Tax=Macrobrachium rosenbergii TaxID=79674 RepID=UPI0034D3F526
MVHMVKCRLVMVCGDGSRCVMSDNEALELDDMRDSRDRDSEFRRYDFYPGQQLVGTARVFEEVEWIHKTREMETALSKPYKQIKVTVEQVQVVQLGVRWQCRAFSNDPNVDKEQPKFLVQGEDLKRVKMLNVFEPCTLQLGDRNYYILREGDTIMTRDQWRRLMAGQLTSDHTNPCPLRPRPAKNKSKRKVRSILVGAENTDEDAAQTDAKKVEVADTSTSNGILGAVGGIVDEDTKGEETPDSDGFIDLDTDDCSDTASISSGASTGSIGTLKNCEMGDGSDISRNERTGHIAIEYLAASGLSQMIIRLPFYLTWLLKALFSVTAYCVAYCLCLPDHLFSISRLLSRTARTARSGKRSKKGPALMTKMMKKRKLKRAKRKTPNEGPTIKTGDQLVVETLMTTSKADVVWQV